jgi:hypothetical protein
MRVMPQPDQPPDCIRHIALADAPSRIGLDFEYSLRGASVRPVVREVQADSLLCLVKLPSLDLGPQAVEEDRDPILERRARSFRNLSQELSHPDHVVAGVLFGHDPAFQQVLSKSAQFQLVFSVIVVHVHLFAPG